MRGVNQSHKFCRVATSDGSRAASAHGRTVFFILRRRVATIEFERVPEGSIVATRRRGILNAGPGLEKPRLPSEVATRLNVSRLSRLDRSRQPDNLRETRT
jgi:hypothetical protein